MANHEILDLAGERARRLWITLFSNSFPFDPVNRYIMYELLTFFHKVEIPFPKHKKTISKEDEVISCDCGPRNNDLK